MNVFISYASQDKGVAELVCHAVESAGLVCWIAPRDVVPGESFASAIVHAIDATQVIVLVLSEYSASSQHVLREVERASSKRHPVIAFRIDLAPMPADFEYFLNTSQWLDASAIGVKNALPRLVDAVKSALTQPSTGPHVNAGAAATAKTTPRRSRALVVKAVIAVLLVIAGGVLWHFARAPQGSLASKVTGTAQGTVASVHALTAVPPERSIAVLPFLDMSEKHDQEYFSDGLSEELIDMLTKVSDLRVPARTSSFYFKGKQATIAEIAKALGVAQVLEGSVRMSGKNVRVTAQLIRADNGYHIWSETYDRKLDEIFKVQDDIATAVVKALKASLPNMPARRSATTTDGEAYTIYLQGRSTFENSSTSAAETAGVEYLERAAKLDPSFAPAWATLSRAYVANYIDNGIGTYPDVRNTAFHAAERALKLDASSAEAHVSMGRVYLLEWNWSGAEQEIGRALALDPANATVARNAYYLFIRLGRFDDAIVHTKAAAELDPLNYYNYGTLGDAEFYAGKLTNAEADYRKALALRADGEGLHSGIAGVLWERGKFDEALAELAREPSAATRELSLPVFLDAAGRKSEANRALALAETKYGRSMPFVIGELYAYRNDLDRAFAWWGRAYQAHDDGLSTIKLAPMDTKSKQLASDPRYKALLRKMKLPE